MARGSSAAIVNGRGDHSWRLSKAGTEIYVHWLPLAPNFNSPGIYPFAGKLRINAYVFY